FEQNNTFFTLENTNLFDYFASSDFAASMSLQQIKRYLGQFGFSGDDVYKDISVLSGGEKVRLLLAKILYPQPDILILDEPTTHLDITTKEILIENLKSFSGALFIVSHDIDFIVRLANKYITIINKNLVNLDDISDYFLLKDLSKENVLRIKNKDNKENSKKNILSTNKRQQIQKEIEEIELQLKDIESQMQKLQYQFSIKNDYESISNLSSEYKRLENKYENLFNRLNELEQMLN
ncbi:MAG TPA: ATP-binding cassette domain-containing protein, partial [Exilispira sp.]|nr:ATP-binding cassette domain-containing protein [Exilispira sp.]